MWIHGITAAIGIWLMIAPAALRYAGTPAADCAHIAGPVIATFGAIAMAEATRSVRWWNMLPCLWLLIAPLIFSHATVAWLNHYAAAIAVIALSSLRGSIRGAYGGGWRALWSEVTNL